MKKRVVKNRNGFTVIEVTLVLAIAGLIFMMVFVALPQLQRQQRDSRRRDDILIFMETLKKFQSNNRGALPTNWNSEFYSKYFGDDFEDPDGTKYQLSVKKCNSGADVTCKNLPNLKAMDHVLHVFVQATCKGSDSVVGTSNPRTAAVLYRLEGSGVYCANT